MSEGNGEVTSEEAIVLFSLGFRGQWVDSNSICRAKQLGQIVSLRRKGFVQESEVRPADEHLYSPPQNGQLKPQLISPFYAVSQQGAEYIEVHMHLMPRELLWEAQRPVA